MTKTYVEVVDGEQSYVPICAVILKGELGHDVTVELSILDTSLGTKGMHFLIKQHGVIMLTITPLSSSRSRLHSEVAHTHIYKRRVC